MHYITDTWKFKENKLGYKNQYKEKLQNMYFLQKVFKKKNPTKVYTAFQTVVSLCQ